LRDAVAAGGLNAANRSDAYQMSPGKSGTILSTGHWPHIGRCRFERRETMKAKLFAVTLAAAGAFAITARAEDMIVVPGEVDSYIAEQPFDESSTYDEDVVIGDTLPDDVVVREVPEHDGYSYAIVKRQRIVVEPRTRKVIKIYQ
jgi:hypothetical protein